jgi:hypothetical protein
MKKRTSTRADQLQSLGRLLAVRHLGLKISGLDFNLVDSSKKTVKVLVKERVNLEELGERFTIEIDLEKEAISTLKVDRMIFIDHDGDKKVRIYECTNPDGYTTSYIGGGREWRRIAMCFPISEMTLIKEIEDEVSVVTMKRLSPSRKVPSSIGKSSKPTWMSY